LEESTGSNKNKLLMIVIIALLVVLLAAMVFVTIMVLGIAGGQDQQEGQFVVPDLRLDQQESIELSGPIATNIRGETGGSHVFSANFVVLVDNTQGNTSAALIELVSASDSIVRGVALHVVRGRTFEELSHPDAMSILEQEILDQLRHEFGSSLIHRVMITNWFVD